MTGTASLLEALPPAERFALRMRRWANEAEAEGRLITPEDVQLALDDFGLHFPAAAIEEDRG